ncbi:hypothetical protein [Paracoccus sp. JM45]|jgi:hypothetical protein|uniref:hypothetical protein n=1 Tax=Paracoccus sp. JM45 TaxID=2283626 RepID=UPI000E6C23F1|nr:hypothetical protein [Paracoccus sp. JM45]RJE79968.1 hypothetical protein DWB67_09705 [Paracoccus sp. JM45]
MNGRRILVAAMMAGLGIASLSASMPDSMRVTEVVAKPVRERPVIGDVPAPAQVTVIGNPGTYGLGSELRGSSYAVVSGHLVRIDRKTGRILSILRPLPQAGH